MIIDAHAHVSGPPELYAAFREATAATGPFRFQPPAISDERLEEALAPHLAEVAGVGTELQLISPRPWAFPTAERRERLVVQMAQTVNDLIARCVTLHPSRFRGIAGLPQVVGVSPAHCAEELERCVRDLGFVGCKINPDPGEGGVPTPHMGDEYWYPLYQKMVELDVPGLIHGGSFRFSREPEAGYFITEQSIAAMGILRSRVFQEFPTLKLIVGHGGGYLPYQIGRARAFRLNEQARDPSLEPFEDSLRRFYFDTVLYNQESVELLLKVVGVERCLFGSDKPANGSVRDPDTGRALNDIRPLVEAVPWLTAADKQALYEDNARRLFRL